MPINVGIDLGTTFSAVAKINTSTGKPEIIKNSLGDTTTPSVLYFCENGDVLFGKEAKELQADGDENAVAFFKRNMGNDDFCIDIYSKQYNSTDLSEIFLKKLISDAETVCGEKIASAVITVPAYFSHKEREATMQAGLRAGINVSAIINEPTAAAFSYGLTNDSTERTILIFDLGGGTFDVTIAKINGESIAIIGSAGNHQLGGKDWDDCLAQYLDRTFSDEFDIDLSMDAEWGSYLNVLAEKTKIQLSERDTVNVPVAYKGKKTKILITREIFEDITQHLLTLTKDVIDSLFSSLKMSWSDIDGAILVGGSTRMSAVKNYLTEMSGRAPISGVNVDEAVALGAAIRANITADGSVCLPGKSNGNGNFRLSIKGAKSIVDVTSHSMGMIAINDSGDKYINSRIIEKNTAIPVKENKQYIFYGDEMEIYVTQGEFERPLDNTIVNKYVVTGFSKKGKKTVDVFYEYDDNNIINVTAYENEIPLQVRIDEVPRDLSWTDRPPEKKTEPVNAELTVFLAIDLSGSMEKRLNAVVTSTLSFIDSLNNGNPKIGIVPFATSTDILVTPTKDLNSVRKKVKGIKKVFKDGTYGYKTSADPFKICMDYINMNSYESKLSFKANEFKYIVVLTDGEWFYPDEAIESAQECKENGIEIMAIGIGDAKLDFLKKIATTDDFASMSDLSQLSNSFSNIAQSISTNMSLGGR